MASDSPSKRQRLSFENQLALATLAASGIPSLVLLMVLWYQDVSPYLVTLLAIVLGALVTWAVASVRNRVLYQFRSMSNLLQAMVNNDYSMRGRMIGKQGALLELVDSINDLSATLTRERLVSVESQLLIGKIIDQIDVAILAIDARQCFTLLNPAARRLLGLYADANLNLSQADDVGGLHLPADLAMLAEQQPGESRIADLTFPERKGRFHVHKERFRDQGLSHELICITDVRTMLRAEERKAWQNLVRVIGHEINNSLSPISSISDTLERRVLEAVQQGQLDGELGASMRENLSLVSQRSASLVDFTERYRKLAQMPEPRLESVDLGKFVKRVVALVGEGETGVIPTAISIATAGDSKLTLMLDAGLMEQALINLLKNALEAMGGDDTEVGDIAGEIAVNWRRSGAYVAITISDEGHGVANPDNLFVPFYTTKPQGSGIGLILCRQIIEAHGGHIMLANRTDRQGCRVDIELPLHSI